MRRSKAYPRPVELVLLLLAALTLALGVFMARSAALVQNAQDPLPGAGLALLPLLVPVALLALAHFALRRSSGEQVILPLVAITFSVGLIMIFRLRGEDGVWQQLTRGFIPGMIVLIVLVAVPGAVERVRRLSLPIALIGLALAFATALFGSVDESGARLALKLGPLPSIQTSEMIKLSLIVFLAWFIEREGEEVEGRARPVLWIFRVPSIRHFVPGLVFVALATLALVQMSDFGAVMILGLIFVLMLYAGFNSRLFATIAAIGLVMAIVAAIVLAFTWQLPGVIQTRWQAFLDPWSNAPVIVDGQPTGLTIAEGPGYQVQQAVYATVAGGLFGAGIGFGSPGYIPLGASDFIFASTLEEMGAVTGITLLAFFAILLLRILRTAVLLPRQQVYERLLLTGIAIHFFTQVFVMVGGTLNLIPLTGVTVPFMSLGGASLLTNLVEIGLVLAVSSRLEGSAS